MKYKLLLFLLLFCTLIGTTFALAQEQEKTSSPSPISLEDDEKVKNLKEKLATKVAELRESQTRGFYGEVAALTKNSFTLDTMSGEVKVRFSEDTTIETGGKTGEIADIKNSSFASVLGLYEPENKQLTARVIILDSKPTYVYGELSAIDKENAALTVKTVNNTMVIDYEKTTISSEYQGEEKIAKSGFSRLVAGDLLHIWISPSEEDNERNQANRLLRIPALVLGISNEATPSTSSATPSAKTTIE
jgi:RNase P/RNase MRP subunit p29